MGESLEIAVKVVTFFGIAWFLYCFGTSMDEIAKALTRIADTQTGKTPPATT